VSTLLTETLLAPRDDVDVDGVSDVEIIDAMPQFNVAHA